VLYYVNNLAFGDAATAKCAGDRCQAWLGSARDVALGR
jgi:hypothetical protein